MEDHNGRLTTGLSAVYPQDDGRSSFLAADQWVVAYLSLQTLVMQGMSGNLDLEVDLDFRGEPCNLFFRTQT